MDRVNQRRWLGSAGVVVLLHVCVAVAVLTWLKVIPVPPVLIDLAPAPSTSEQTEIQPVPPPAPVAEQSAPQQRGPEQNKTEPASAPAEQAPAPNETAAKAEQSTGPAQASSGMSAPQVPSSPLGAAAENGPAGGTIGGGGISRPPAPAELGGRAATTGPAAGANSTVPGPVASAPAPSGAMPHRPVPGSPMANMPLDTSITVQPPVHSNNGIGPFGRGEFGPLASREAGPEAAPFDQKPISVFRSAKPFGVPDVPRNSLSPNGNPSLSGIGLKNAPGAHVEDRVQDRARAAMARTMSGGQTAKNAIGGAVTGYAVPYNALRGGSSATTIASRGDTNGLGTDNGVVRNAIGVTANFRPRIPRANAGESKADAVTIAGHEMPTAPIINGHDLARPMSGRGVIGGPAHRTGVLSGSDFHLRHP